MRKNDIDNIRILCILLLFPYHTSMVFNTFGDPFYVFSTPVVGLSEFMVMAYPWWMTLLFTLAGVSSAYALRKRSGKQYAKERVVKLFIPLLFAILLIVPVQSYIADVFHHGYKGNYFQHYRIFFTKLTDLTGYDGGFTPAHTWFILYLFVISIIALPIMLWYKKRDKQISGHKVTMPIVLSMVLFIWIMFPVLNIGGKSIGEAFACFLIGFFVISLDEVQERLATYRIPLLVSWVLLMIVRSYMHLHELWGGLAWDIEQRLLTWIGILAIMGLGKQYLNFTNRFTQYFSPAAFPVYFFHQSVLVVVAYYAVQVTHVVFFQFVLILIMSFILTLLCYEILRRFSVTCFMFGMKYEKKNLLIRKGKSIQNL